MFLPTTLDSAERIVETIQMIKERIPDNPLEADLIMMAEMVAEDSEKDKAVSQGGTPIAVLSMAHTHFTLISLNISNKSDHLWSRVRICY